MGGTPAQTRSERVLEQPNEPPLSEGHTSRSGEGIMEHTFKLTDTVPPTSHDSPLTGSYTPKSDEDEEEPSLDIEDSPKQGRMIGEIDKDKNVNLVSKQGEINETVVPLKDDDDATLAETLLNIKRSTSKEKGKGIMQETKLPKKIKKREMIQLSLNEDLAQKLQAEELAKETARPEQEKYNLEKALELQKQLDQMEEDIDKGDQTQNIDWNDPEVLRYHALQNRVFSKAEKRKLKGDSDQEVEEMKLYVKIVPDEEISIDVIPLATKPPMIVEYKIVKEGKISTYHIIRADESTKRYTSMINLLENIDREDLETL
uniref:Uncharacterized protein n=1 Tax=Tanacetum cinerariifolium TaxID=118510 RepID=A0A699HAS7_TANCI|nr:hypothetical protein [Tanacetum cinerariifolium]